MKDKTREIVAFILNLFPGLGFCFSGTVHNLKWLRFLGSVLIAGFLFMVPICVVVVYARPLINYHFTASELLLASAIALVFGILGADVERKFSKEKRE